MSKTLAGKQPGAATTSGRQDETEVDPHKDMFPYILYGRGAYFGDVEVVQSRPRKATARCESDVGCLLTLGKQEFKELGDHFPNFGVKWEQMAAVHERSRINKLARLRQGRTYRHLAASVIQGWFREWQKIALNDGDYDMTRRTSLVQKRAMSILMAGKGADSVHMYDQQKRMHAEMRELTRTVGDIARQVELISQGIGCSASI